jgi:protein-disulfide isomerase
MMKFNNLSRYLIPGIAMLIGFAGGALLISSNILAQETRAPESPNAELVDRISREVVRRLLEEGALDKPIELGIQRYIAKQQQAQADAQASAQANAQAKAKNVRPVTSERDHIYGNINAAVSLIEYSDFECPYCKRFHPTAKKVIDSFDGQVNWVYRHFPLGFHNPLAQLEAEASECAAALGGNEAFWRYTDMLYERTSSNGKGLLPELLTPFAGEIGLDEAKFKECLESGRMKTRVLDDFDEGSRIGISGTPGNVIRNNETGEVMVAAGALPFEDMRRMVDRLLNDVKQ